MKPSTSCLERYVYQDEELSFVDSVPSASMGEASTLADFLDFCSTNYPADHTAVIFWVTVPAALPASPSMRSTITTL